MSQFTKIPVSRDFININFKYLKVKHRTAKKRLGHRPQELGLIRRQGQILMCTFNVCGTGRGDAWELYFIDKCEAWSRKYNPGVLLGKVCTMTMWDRKMIVAPAAKCWESPKAAMSLYHGYSCSRAAQTSHPVSHCWGYRAPSPTECLLILPTWSRRVPGPGSLPVMEAAHLARLKRLGEQPTMSSLKLGWIPMAPTSPL